MRYLLDTHVFVWAASAPGRLTPGGRALLEDGVPTFFLSVASAHELTIKWRLGKLSLPEDPRQFVPSRMAHLRVQELPVTIRHATHVGTLPLLHGDPFDRILVAQAQLEGLTIVTRDSNIPRYDVPVVPA